MIFKKVMWLDDIGVIELAQNTEFIQSITLQVMHLLFIYYFYGPRNISLFGQHFVYFTHGRTSYLLKDPIVLFKIIFIKFDKHLFAYF